MSENHLTGNPLVIDDTPYLLWDFDLKTHNIEFLENIDLSHFEYLANVHGNQLDGENKHHAALALRTAYSQGLETLFAFLAALIQAPHCVAGWITHYKTKDLESFIYKFQNQQRVYSVLPDEFMSWDGISEAIHMGLVAKDNKEKETIIKGFGRLWRMFAVDFLTNEAKDEYNSIKHGLRVQPGGFELAIGPEITPGVPLPQEKWIQIGKSDFGSTFPTVYKIVGRKLHFQLRNHSRNWNPIDLANGLLLISVSLNNIVERLKILNGVGIDQVSFRALSDEKEFLKPWKNSYSIGTTHFSQELYPLKIEDVPNYSKEEILRLYESRK